jgi:hypothetical protein
MDLELKGSAAREPIYDPILELLPCAVNGPRSSAELALTILAPATLMKRVGAIFWLFGFVALLAASMPSVAHAHAGHNHHAHVHHPVVSTPQSQEQAVPQGAATEQSPAAAISASTSFPVSDPLTMPSCGDRGCCTASHCASCAAIIEPVVSDAWHAASSVAYGAYMAPPVTSAPANGLRRPPRSLS